MKFSSACIAIAAVIASGCAAEKVWDKPGATPYDYNRDGYDCGKVARQAGYRSGDPKDPNSTQDFFGRCMAAHGWVLVDKRKSFSSGSHIDSPCLNGCMSEGGSEAFCRGQCPD